MITPLIDPALGADEACPFEAALFAGLAEQLATRGWCVLPDALPAALGDALLGYLPTLDEGLFHEAGIGRQDEHMRNAFVRRDEICWITGEVPATRAWLAFMERLRSALNRELMLGLFSFESHFAHYPIGAFYKRHVDAFRGQANRVLSVVTYLNPGWAPDDGGELVLYPPEPCDADYPVTPELPTEGLRVVPAFGTIVVFLSELFPHEVLTAQRPRRSIAGWYRVNATTGQKVDPPR